MKTHLIKSLKPIGLHFETADPFLFCAHHLDNFPKANEQMGPAVSLAGRAIGEDFTLKDGFRMYHGHVVPGFPEHPHRGFETVTVVVKGLVDHSDSFGAAGRYGAGDVQWMTAGCGMQHAEMFPLLNKDADNPCELFQIWLNLPAAKKMVEPHYKMLWSENIPQVLLTDNNGKNTRIRIIAGKVGDVTALEPAPDSWATDAVNAVDIHLIALDPGAEWVLPAAAKGSNRTVYFYEGSSIEVDSTIVDVNHAIELVAETDVLFRNGENVAHLLLLQGRPIAEPVVQYGPFVMNTEAEIQQTFNDYRKTQFGGWPWDRPDPVHPRDKGRFARFADGREEFPPAEFK